MDDSTANPVRALRGRERSDQMTIEETVEDRRRNPYHSRRSYSSTSSVESSKSVSTDKPRETIDPVKGRIGRITKSHRRGRYGYWVNQQKWEDERPDNIIEEPDRVAERSWAAVGLDDTTDPIRILIWSRHLMDAFKLVNKVPELNSSLSNVVYRDEINVAYPFGNLFHNMPALCAEIEKNNSADALLDLKALDTVIEECVTSDWKAARYCLEMKDDSVSFNTLWAHFIPGDYVIVKDKLGMEWLSIFIGIGYHDPKNFSQRELQRGGLSNYNMIRIWNLTWDAARRVFRRVQTSYKVKSFEGRRPFVSLPVYPLKYRSGDIDQFKQYLGARGRKWRDLLLGNPSKYRSHEGLSFTPRLIPKPGTVKPQVSKTTGRVIRDDQPKNGTKSVRMGLDSDSESERNEDRWLLPGEDEREEYSWPDIEPEVELTNIQAELCQPVLVCNNITSGEEQIVSIDNLSPVDWNQAALESLVLPKHEKDLLVGLVQHHASKTGNARSDLIQNKGKGLVILLYGPPGTGKTLTAESVGETVGKPLIPLSIGGLIADEGGFENRLRQEFEKATRWDAILLLDEADVLLEARSFEDVTRNGIVSSFLRHLEYFNGILFLTTNRMETMDDAFQSRISVAIRFKKLNSLTRINIWKSLLKDRLSRDEPFSTPGAASEIRKNVEWLAEAHLNGRQIRNVLNIAEGLAFTETREPGQVTLKHVKSARKSAAEFERYFKTGKGNEAGKTTSIWATSRGKGKDQGFESDMSESDSEY